MRLPAQSPQAHSCHSPLVYDVPSCGVGYRTSIHLLVAPPTVAIAVAASDQKAQKASTL